MYGYHSSSEELFFLPIFIIYAHLGRCILCATVGFVLSKPMPSSCPCPWMSAFRCHHTWPLCVIWGCLRGCSLLSLLSLALLVSFLAVHSFWPSLRLLASLGAPGSPTSSLSCRPPPFPRLEPFLPTLCLVWPLPSLCGALPHLPAYAVTTHAGDALLYIFNLDVLAILRELTPEFQNSAPWFLV